MSFDSQGVIFDFNGTLFFDSDKHALAWGKIARELRGAGLTDQELQQHFYGVPNNRAVEYLLQRECDMEEANHYSELKEAYYREFCREDKKRFHLVAGAEEMFDLLTERQIPFTIASASIKPNIDFFVESFGLARWFDPEKIVYDDGSYENKVEMFLQAAKVLNVPIEECLIFEDSKSGIRDAYKAGCRNIVVIDSMEVAEKYEGQDGILAICKDFTEEFIKNMELDKEGNVRK